MMNLKIIYFLKKFAIYFNFFIYTLKLLDVENMN